MLSMNEIKSCMIYWKNGRSDKMELGTGETIIYVLTMFDRYEKIEFDFAGQTWVAIANPDGRNGVLLASSDLARQEFVEMNSGMNEFIEALRVAMRTLLYDICGNDYTASHPDALVVLG